MGEPWPLTRATTSQRQAGGDVQGPPGALTASHRPPDAIALGARYVSTYIACLFFADSLSALLSQLARTLASFRSALLSKFPAVGQVASASLTGTPLPTQGAGAASSAAAGTTGFGPCVVELLEEVRGAAHHAPGTPPLAWTGALFGGDSTRCLF